MASADPLPRECRALEGSGRKARAALRSRAPASPFPRPRNEAPGRARPKPQHSGPRAAATITVHLCFSADCPNSNCHSGSSGRNFFNIGSLWSQDVKIREYFDA